MSLIFYGFYMVLESIENYFALHSKTVITRQKLGSYERELSPLFGAHCEQLILWYPDRSALDCSTIGPKSVLSIISQAAVNQKVN